MRINAPVLDFDLKTVAASTASTFASSNSTNES
jgi:hypothetical protein